MKWSFLVVSIIWPSNRDIAIPRSMQCFLLGFVFGYEAKLNETKWNKNGDIAIPLSPHLVFELQRGLAVWSCSRSKSDRKSAIGEQNTLVIEFIRWNIIKLTVPNLRSAFSPIRTSLRNKTNKQMYNRDKILENRSQSKSDIKLLGN